MDSELLKESPYNSELEYSLRAIIVLAELEYPMTLERLVAYDFISVYPSSFGLKGDNLHGENVLKFSEFSARHEMMKKALGALLSRGFVEFSIFPDGYYYSVTAKGLSFSEKLKNSYARKMRLNVINTDDFFHGKDDISIAKAINEKAIETLEN